MRKILILLAHPRFEKSRINSALIRSVADEGYVTVHDLYELYPDFNIDVAAEKKLLLGNDILVWQHPLYFYGCPPLLKQWIDMVFEFGWAFGSEKVQLANKIVVNVISTGGSAEGFKRGGHHGYTLKEFLTPFEQTARLCRMIYLPPFAVQGSYRLNDAEIEGHTVDYRNLLRELSRRERDPAELMRLDQLNGYNWSPHFSEGG